MRRKPSFELAAVSVLCCMILAACNCAPTLRYVSVAPASATIFLAANTSGATTTYVSCTTQQFAATAYYSDGSQADISSTAGWSSSNSSAATISAAGLATAATSAAPSGATTVISATAGGAAGTANLTVNVLTAIAVTPANATIPLGVSQAYTATGTFTTPGSKTPITMDLTSQVTWSVPAGNTVASIDNTGLLTTNGTGQGQGTTTVSATLCGLSGSTGVTVGAPVPTTTVQIAPAAPTAAVGQTVDFTAAFLNTDGSTTPVSTPVAWTSGTTTVANVIATNPAAPYDGSVAALTTGTSTITATTGTAPNAYTATTTLTVAAAVARFAYVANRFDGSVSGYATHAANGHLTSLGKIMANGTGQIDQVVAHPSGLFLYSINGDGVTVYSVNPVSGALTDAGLTGGALTAGGSYFGAVDPSGRWLYVASSSLTTQQVSAFSINQSTGALTLIGSVPNPATSPSDLHVTPNGQFVYVINSDNSISAYAINSTTGALTAVTNPTTTLNSPVFGAIDPTSTYLFVANHGNSTITPFTIGTTGALTAGTPFAVTGATNLGSLVVDPTSKFLYVVDPTAPGVFVLSIGTGGALTQTINGGSAYPLGSQPLGIAIDPTGKTVLVANDTSNTLSVFTAAADGSLTADPQVQTAGGPAFPVFVNGTAEAASSVSSVVAANSTAGTLSDFTLGSTGALTAVNTTPFASVAGNSYVATSGTSVFTSSPSAMELAGYTVNPASATATFTSVGTPVTLAGAAGSVIADAGGSNVYVADTTNGTVSEYATSNLNGVNTAFTVPGGVLSLASDPETTVIYALGANSLTPLLTSANNGALVLGTAVTTTDKWVAGAVSPSGQWLAAVDAITNTIQVFSISPVIKSGTDGNLTAAGSPVAIPVAMTVSSVAWDPLGRILVVTDSKANTVTPFKVSSTGTLTAGTALTTPTGATQAVFDPTGSWLFVGVNGTTTPAPGTAGGVQVYQVASSGALTAVGTPVAADLGTWGVGVLNTVQ
jgi:6-phosphogluconolactonase (cycloisomerase 2 family)